MPNPPRLNPNDRILHRLYEPLVLLHILEPSTRQTRSISSPQNLQDSSDRLCAFVDQLSWICDHDLGGGSVTAIAAQEEDSRPVYWIVAPGPPRQAVRAQVSLVLDQLSCAYSATELERKTTILNLHAQCVDFSSKKVKNYRHFLKVALSMCAELPDVHQTGI